MLHLSLLSFTGYPQFLSFPFGASISKLICLPHACPSHPTHLTWTNCSEPIRGQHTLPASTVLRALFSPASSIIQLCPPVTQFTSPISDAQFNLCVCVLEFDLLAYLVCLLDLLSITKHQLRFAQILASSVIRRVDR